MTSSAACATAVCSSASRSTGKERDTESGNGYFGARYYASSMGRFMSPDWSAKIMPVPYAKLDDPQTLNLYAYVGNNPLRGLDVNGHKAIDCSGSNANGVGCQFIAQWKKDHGIVDTAHDEKGAEMQATANLAKYKQNHPLWAPGDKSDSMRLTPTCSSGNHDCKYALSGEGSYGGQDNAYYVWEHQTYPVEGSQQVGPGDYITPAGSVTPDKNQFQDTLTADDSYRFFTVSRNSTYQSSDQVPVAVHEGGEDYEYEHIFTVKYFGLIIGQTYLNGHSDLQ